MREEVPYSALKKSNWLAVVAHAFNPFNPSTPEAEADGVCGQPGLQSGFQDNKGYTVKPCLANKTTMKNLI